MDVLLVVDVQNDFLPGGSLAVAGGDKIIPVINGLQKHFDLVVATQDWHPGNHKSFASNHPGKKPFEQIELNGLPQTLWPDHCLQGGWGAQWPQALNLNLAETIFRKGTNPEIDSYSGFYDNDHRKSTGLADYLRGKKPSRLFITGLCTEICVFFTAMDSLKEGFETLIIEDATCPLVTDDSLKTNQAFIDNGGRLIHSSAIIERHT